MDMILIRKWLSIPMLLEMSEKELLVTLSAKAEAWRDGIKDELEKRKVELVAETADIDAKLSAISVKPIIAEEPIQ